ncbi:lasso peptide biosynthesis B2 protein [Peterkaempfera griseoplana]|uniref:lasso peptide biosynthesis B2 protein n=1 Tax=Peterkaempfera griseoplana TaxID=66896 RepID=UPI00099E91CB|nr:lasso peptide biosynthesis B2 protein [Peterkaempfera griseoplana]
MAERTDALTAIAEILSPYCHIVEVSGGALIADWSRTRFLGVSTADILRFADGKPEDRAELLDELVRAGCARPRRREYSYREVGAWLRGIDLLTRTIGFGRTLRVLSLLAPDYARADTASAPCLASLKRAVQSHGRRSWLVGDDCKTQALTAYILLRRRGLRAALHVGMREHPFAMHAWTSCGGVCIPDADPGGHAFARVLSLKGGGQ